MHLGKSYPRLAGYMPRSMNVVMRTVPPPETLAGSARAQVWGLDPTLPLAELQSMEENLWGSVARPRFLTLLLGVFALGLGLGLAATGTYNRDVVHAIPFALQLGLLLTPIMYPLENVSEKWQTLYSLNPMVGITEAFRSVLVYAQQPDLELLGISCLGTLVVWCLAWPLFRKTSRYFADVL